VGLIVKAVCLSVNFTSPGGYARVPERKWMGGGVCLSVIAPGQKLRICS